ncbi:(DL)-glycerol-3-phosphatase 2 [Fusarium oxysporum f. sp. cubense race 1]|uniref:(DL)-glycerol-3-phosphatase 2 n=1 Tax=Fusarium oxysporum f. sp. cubense (strain race 1) TaxID=1229664 RepID=N4UQ60_FUSC1|nr:(DL)-glycerol-3-phosphatase 2 [Fusarium oxysporum f. sp. cubense race 1]
MRRFLTGSSLTWTGRSSTQQKRSSSIGQSKRSLETVGKRINVNPRVILEMSHGRRSLDVLQVIAPDFATWDFVRSIESVIPVNHGHLAKEIPGAIDFLSALAAHSVPWALVTSSTLPLVQQWRETRNLALPTAPKLLVTAESVENGKPDPAAYVLGRERLGLVDEQFDILVIEDSPAGIAAGKAAGYCVVDARLDLAGSAVAEDLAKYEREGGG